MAENTKIEWATHTFNPWAGCEKVSEGCKFCYAERDQNRFRFVEWGPDADRRRTSAAYWRKPIQWNAEQERAEAEARATGQPLPMRPRIFAASWADLFEVPVTPKNLANLTAWRNEFHDLVELTPYLIWLGLTKRADEQARYYREERRIPANMLPGVTAENQRRFDERVPHIASLGVPWFLSAEPLLGPINMSMRTNRVELPPGLVWVIPGGESGPKARPMLSVWVRGLRDQVLEANASRPIGQNAVALLFKQWGEHVDDGCPNHHELGAPALYVNQVTGQTVRPIAGARPLPNWTPVWRVGREAAGRMLDGRTWDDLPGVFRAA